MGFHLSLGDFMVLLLPGMFEFAAPPKTGGLWFVQACREAGLMLFPDEVAATAFLYPWPEQIKRSKDTLRVSLVRHPCDWLRSIYEIFWDRSLKNPPGVLQFWTLFLDLPSFSFEKFVAEYLKEMPGEVTRVFDSYKADSRMRLEDMPWALVELLKSMGIEQKNLDRVIALDGQQDVSKQIKWRSDLRQQVMEAEAKFCQDLDYY